MATSASHYALPNWTSAGPKSAWSNWPYAADRRRFTPVVYCLGERPIPNRVLLLPTSRRPAWRSIASADIGSGSSRVMNTRLSGCWPPKTQIFKRSCFTRISSAASPLAGPACRRGLGRSRCPAATVLAAVGRLVTQRLVDRYVCVSQSVADFSASTAGLPAEKLVVIPNGVDISRFTSVKPADLASWSAFNGRRLGHVHRRLDAQKGLP